MRCSNEISDTTHNGHHFILCVCCLHLHPHTHTHSNILLVRACFSRYGLQTLQFFYCFPLSLSSHIGSMDFIWFVSSLLPSLISLTLPLRCVFLSLSLTWNKYLPQMSPCAKFCLNGIVLNGARDILRTMHCEYHSRPYIEHLRRSHSCHPSGPHINIINIYMNIHTSTHTHKHSYIHSLLYTFTMQNVPTYLDFRPVYL